MKITADFSNITGKMMPVHGFNNASRKTGYGEVLPDFLSLKPPFVRLHDTCGFFGGAHYVDIPNIFPDFNADADDENSYDFTFTDCYIKPLAEAGIDIMYRLGVTIEHGPVKYHVYPPENPEKWADICEHIVRHYNNGWANGFHFNIKYWEIWNEPDGLDKNIEPYGPPMWNGTAEEYYNLYCITAKRIKELHPEALVGGYSSCFILGKFAEGRWQEGDASYFYSFLEHIKSENAPLDFFSYHGYLGKNYIEKIEKEFSFVKNTLCNYGFSDTLIFDTEWNTNICNKETDDRRTEYYINMRNEAGASHAAAALYEMQRLKLDGAMFYDAQLWWEYGCLFEVPSLAKTKTYFAFSRFSEMFELGNECFVDYPKGVYACGAKGEYAMLGISNTGDNDIPLEIELKNISGRINIYETSKEHTNEIIYESDFMPKMKITLKSNSFVTLEIGKII